MKKIMYTIEWVEMLLGINVFGRAKVMLRKTIEIWGGGRLGS